MGHCCDLGAQLLGGADFFSVVFLAAAGPGLSALGSVGRGASSDEESAVASGFSSPADSAIASAAAAESGVRPVTSASPDPGASSELLAAPEPRAELVELGALVLEPNDDVDG